MGNGIAQVFADARQLQVANDRHRSGGISSAGKAAIEKSLGRAWSRKEKHQREDESQATVIGRIAVSRTELKDAVGRRSSAVEAVVEKHARSRRRSFPKLDRGHAREDQHPGDEHIVDLDHRNRGQRPKPRRQGHRDALHEPRAADEAGRSDPKVRRPATRRQLPGLSPAPKSLGKVAVEAQDYPGFVSNRVLMPMINEAVYCLMEGVATEEGHRHGHEARHESPDGPPGPG